MLPRATLVLCLLAGTAVAQERPSLVPTRDVDITYHLLGPHPGTLHMSTQANTGLTRVDNPNQHGYAIIDRRNHHMTMVMTERQTYIEAPTAGAEQHSPDLDPTARFTRQGTDTVAGLRCTVWEYANDHMSGSACVTDDGVLLRSRDSTGQHGLEAAEVSYVSRPDADFHPPPGFTQQQMPTMGGMPPGHPPPR